MYGNRMVNEMSFVRNIFLSIIGSLYWGYLIRKCKYIKNTAVVLIPHNAGEDELYAYELIDNLIKENRYDNAVFLCSNRRNLKIQIKSQITIKKIGRLGEKSLRQFYLLMRFDKRFYYASIDGLFRRNGNYLIGINGLDRREIFARGVYRISVEY